MLAEALRNADKHARADAACGCASGSVDGAFVLEVRNDGARSDTRGTGMGLRLAAVEALGRGALRGVRPRGAPTGGCAWWCLSMEDGE